MNKITGLTQSQVKENREKYGTNALTELPRETLARKFFNNLKLYVNITYFLATLE